MMDKLGVPLHVYYLAHHWDGRLAVVQGLVHMLLAVLPGTGRQDISPSSIVASLLSKERFSPNSLQLSVSLFGILIFQSIQ